MIRKLSVFFVALAFMSVAFAQNKPYPNVIINGDEVSTNTISSGLDMSGQKIHFPPVQNSLFTWTVNPMTTLASGYDLQSNGSTQELWYDLTNGYLHAAYCTSQQTAAWSDRTITYFFSDDQGVNWSELGNVPPPAPTGARSGFPSIIGLTNGAAVITSHHNGGDGFNTSKIHIDSGPAEFNFTQYNPGKAPNNQGEPIWGKMTLNADGNVVLASSISTASFPQGDSAYTNVLNTTSGTFSGWNIYNSDQAETYAVATSPSGKIGNAYIGGVGKDGWAFYRESNDGGLTWSSPVTVYDPGVGDTILGTIRGVDLTFAGESPCVVYEVIMQITSSGTYFAGLPSEIHFWNPDLNGGNYIVLADSNNVPYYPYNGTNDVQGPICRPVIGKAQGSEQTLFVAFDATTEFYSTTADTTSFCAGFFMVSQNAGATWTTPEQFTPVGNPLLDFRFPSIAPVAPVTGNVATVHISMQGDPTPGSQVNGAPAGITAQFFHFTTDIPLQTTSDIPVTFNVDMGVQAFEGNFPVGANVVVRGSFQADAGDPGGNWQGNMFQLSDADGDTIYTGTFNMPASFAGTAYAYKYVIVNPPAGDNWESTPDRPFTLTAPATNNPLVWFNDDNIYTQLEPVTNTIEFTADITALLNSGVGGAFDPDQDSLLVMGLDWDNLGKDVVGSRRMVNNSILPGIYTTTLTVTSGSAAANGIGDSTKWKFKAFPDARFVNGGWETTPDRWHIYVADGSVVTLPTIVPSILALQAPLTDATPVRFEVDMTGAVNRYNGLTIPLNELEFVGIRGGADFLGNWNSGGWNVSDTIPTPKLMNVLHNVGGNVWSVTLTAPVGQNSGPYQFKFAAVYPGADTVNGGSSPLDNEAGFGFNHSFVLQNAPSGIFLHNLFGDMINSVKEIPGDGLPIAYDLGQNYPNPFNPTTSIRFSIPESGLVTLKVFNLLGQEVAILFNGEKTSGVYEATFDASSISSGIYFYTLEAKNFTSTKKMILLK